MFTQPIKAIQMFEHGDSLDKQKGRLLLMPLSTNFTAK